MFDSLEYMLLEINTFLVNTELIFRDSYYSSTVVGRDRVCVTETSDENE
jgi:hypothetical protein